MHFPTLTPTKTTESVIRTFGGIDTTISCPENCFSDTKNTSSSLFPILSTRQKRLWLSDFSTPPSALHTVNGITCTVGNSLYYNGVLQYDGLSNISDKHLVSMGSKIIVFPDGYYINTLDVDENGLCKERGSITDEISYGDSTSVTIYPCLKDMPLPTKSAAPPASNENTLWLDLNESPAVLKQYSEETDEWVKIQTDCCCIEIEGIDKHFGANDAIEINGLDTHIDGNANILSAEENGIIIDLPYESLFAFEIPADNNCKIKKLLPIMDFICEHQNRLFGCRYGLDRKGNFVNEIYASKLGEPGIWNAYNGLSTDSYAASCGSEGAFTGIISHMGYVVFFKENRIHRLFGTKPSNYTLYEDSFDGVKLGSEKSLCLHNGTLYYHGKNGIYSYSGSTPTLLSRSLGNVSFKNAVAAFCQNKYYISLVSQTGTPFLYAYDTERSIWHKEDSSRYTHLSALENNIIGIKEDNGCYSAELIGSNDIPVLLSKLGVSPIREDDFDWYAETSDIGFFTDDAKSLIRLKLRLKADRGSSLRLYIMTDSSGIWKMCGSFTGSPLKTVTLNAVPPRCDHLRLKLVGKGGCKIYSISKIFEYAGEVI